MSTRYASLGAGLRRSPKTSVIQPWFRRAQFEFVASNSANVTYGTTAHAKGAWSQIHSSTPSRSNLIIVSAVSNLSASALVDVGVGAAGSEVAVVSNLLFGGSTNFGFLLPVAIPSGSRVSLRIQGTSTSPTAASMGIYLMRSDSDYALTPTTLETIGVDATTSNGTAMSGASGTWVQLTASTASDYQTVVMFANAAGGSGTVTPTFTLGAGASGSEVALAAMRQRWASTNLSANVANPVFVAAWSGPIRAGSRLAVRHDLASNPGGYYAALYGVPYV